jgi:pimeloyl-ACP methyl ester carboxylesterase
MISYNRPGYPGSARARGRVVADAAADVEAIADHFGIDRFSVIGRSGGGPHALACAADKRLRDRLICAASLCGLAPFDADGLNWFGGMVESNVTAYQQAARSNLPALIALFNLQAERVRDNSQGLLNMLHPELGGSDRQVMGDVALRRNIARTHFEALRESIDGWIDDVIALTHPWTVDLADISAPVLLWHGADDDVVPANHSRWLHQQVPGSELSLLPGAAHFEAIKVLPQILGWVRDQAIGCSDRTGRSRPRRSERQRVDSGQQPMADAGLGHVRVVGTEQLC